MRCRSGRVRCRTSVSGPREHCGDGFAASHDIATSHLQHRVRHRTRPVRCRYIAPEPEATERHRRLPGRHRNIAPEARAPTGGGNSKETARTIRETFGHTPRATSRATSRKAWAMSLHRSRALVRCCDVAQGGCDVATSPRARENVAGVGAPHRTTSLHRAAAARATSHKACAMSHATSAGVTCDIAPPPNHIATSQNSP